MMRARLALKILRHVRLMENCLGCRTQQRIRGMNPCCGAYGGRRCRMKPAAAALARWRPRYSEGQYRAAHRRYWAGSEFKVPFQHYKKYMT